MSASSARAVTKAPINLWSVEREIGIERGFPRDRKSDSRWWLGREASLDGEALFD